MQKISLRRAGIVLALVVLAGESPRQLAAQAGPTLVVTSTLDSGPGTLREVISAAESGATIRFSLPAGETIGLLSQVAINTNLTLDGPGADTLAISGQGVTRIFVVAPGATMTITGLTLRRGRAVDGYGGAILNYGTLTIRDAAIVDSVVDGGAGEPGHVQFGPFQSLMTASGGGGGGGAGGGAIFNAGTLRLERSTLSGNTARGGSGGPGIRGGLFNQNQSGAGGGGGGGFGGAILNEGGVVDIVGSTLSGNEARGGTGGGKATFAGSAVDGNGGAGGGGYGDQGEPGNGDGGAVGGAAGVGGGGGAGYAGGDGLHGGGGGFGGGGGGGGGIAGIAGTAAGEGGLGGFGGGGGAGIRAAHGTGNRGSVGGADGGGGGAGFGGAVYSRAGIVRVEGATIVGNTAAGGANPAGTLVGSGVGGGITGFSAAITLRNSIVALNTASPVYASPDVYSFGPPNVGSAGHNIIGCDSTFGQFAPKPSDQVGRGIPSCSEALDPGIGVLADNGGPTQTHALLEGSIAIDAGDRSDVPATDQRGAGFDRVVGTGVDIGAYEALNAKPGNEPATVSLSIDPDAATPLGAPIVMTASVPGAGDGPEWVQFTSSASGELATIPLVSGTATLSRMLPAGSYNLRARLLSFSRNGSASTPHDVTQSASSLTIRALPSTVEERDQAVILATAGLQRGPFAPTGKITFREGATILASVAIHSGSATFSSTAFPIGPHTITAAYAGDGNYLQASIATTIHVTSRVSASEPVIPIRVWRVTSLADEGAGTLRDSIHYAASGDVIVFDVTGNILVRSTLRIDKPLSILGPGPGQLSLDGGGVWRPIAILSGGVTLRGVSLINGVAQGGIGGSGWAGGGGAAGMGGGAFVDAPTGGPVRFEDVQFRNNYAIGGAGGNGLPLGRDAAHDASMGGQFTGTGGGGGIDYHGGDSTLYYQNYAGQGGAGGILGGAAGSSMVIETTSIRDAKLYRGGDGGDGAGGGGGLLEPGGKGGYGGGGGGGTDGNPAIEGLGGYGGGGGGKGGSADRSNIAPGGGVWGGRGGDNVENANCVKIPLLGTLVDCGAVHDSGGAGGGGAGLGGGLFIRRGRVTIAGGSFAGNHALGARPGVTVYFNKVLNSPNSPQFAGGGAGKGGAIYNDQGEVFFASATGYSGNTEQNGAFVDNDGTCGVNYEPPNLCGAGVGIFNQQYRVGLVLPISGSGQQTPIGAPFGQPIRVILLARLSGAPISGGVTITLPIQGPSAFFPGNSRTATLFPGSDGIATLPVLTANSIAGSYVIYVNAQLADGSSVSTEIPLTNTASTQPGFGFVTLNSDDFNPSGFGDEITLSANVVLTHPIGGAAGVVAFYDGVDLIGTAPLASPVLRTRRLAVGPHQLKATYTGDTTNAPGTSPALWRVVQASPSTAFVTAHTPSCISSSRLLRGHLWSDAALDLVVLCGDGSVMPLNGTGSGGFESGAIHPAGIDYGRGVALADFNNDGRLDIAGTEFGGNARLRIWFGLGAGAFASGPLAEGLIGFEIVAADVNRDGRLDIVSGFGANVTTMLGNGDGTFQAPNSRALAANSGRGFALADFNIDGVPDVAVALTNNQIALLFGAGDGTFAEPVYYPVFGAVHQFVAADLNGDGRVDVAASQPDAGVISLFFSRPGGGLMLPNPVVPAGLEPSSLATGDVDGDGFVDLVVARALGNSLRILRGRGNGTFLPFVEHSIPPGIGAGAPAIAIDEFNGDGRTDIVVGVDAQPFLTTFMSTLAVVWTAPAPIRFRTELGPEQLNAAISPAGVEGAFEYAPPSGTVLPGGTWALAVTFRPSDPRERPVSATVNIVVIPKETQTIEFEALPDRVYGDTFAISPQASSGLPVTLAVVAGSATIDGTQVTITGTAPVTIRASQAGNETFVAAPDVERSFTVARASQTITFPLNEEVEYALTFPLFASASSNLPLTFQIISGPATLNGDLLTPYELGVVTVRASQAGNDNFEPAPDADRTFTVVKAWQSLPGYNLPYPMVRGVPVQVPTVTSAGLPINWPFPVDASGLWIPTFVSQFVFIYADNAGNDHYRPFHQQFGFQVDRNPALNPLANVSVSMQPALVSPGQEATLQLVVENSGPDEATGVVLKVTDFGTITSTEGCPGGWIATPFDNSVRSCQVGTIYPGKVRVASVRVRPPSPLQYYVSASVRQVEVDPDPSNNDIVSFIGIRTVVDLALRESHLPTVPSIGEVINFALIAENRGALPADFRVSTDITHAGGVVHYETNIGLGPGQETTPLLPPFIPQAGGLVTITSRVVDLNSGAQDPEPTNNVVTATLTVRSDNHAPVLTTPTLILATLAGENGTIIYYPATATDAEDGVLQPVCTPPSGSTFPRFTTWVDCSVTDSHGATATRSFNVNVNTAVRTNKPAFTPPANITTEGTSPDGATVTFAAVGLDVEDGPIPAVCDHGSGSLFATGITTVHCTVTDAGGLVATGSFTVTVTPWSVPTASITRIEPAAVLRGSGDTLIAIHGGGFVAGVTVVRANGEVVPHAFESPAEIRATLPASLFADRGVIYVTASNTAAGAAISELFVTDAPTTVESAVTAVATGDPAAPPLAIAVGSSGGSPNTLFVNADGGGAGRVTAATYTSNPGGALAAGDHFFDVFVSSGSTFQTLTIRTCELGAATEVQWFSDAGWQLASHQTYVAPTETSPACVEVLVNSVDTSPLLSQLSGTFFAVVVDPTAPATTASAGGYPFGAWTNRDVPVELHASDDGAGVASLTYSAAGAQVIAAATTAAADAALIIAAEGETTVSFYAVDRAGNVEAMKSAVVRIDRTAPVLTVPAGVIVEATSPQGAVATFAATARDSRDPAPQVSCVPNSGDQFAFGSTPVTCPAIDHAGNNSASSFNVTVRDTTKPDIQKLTPAIGRITKHMFPVSIAVTATDAGDASLVCRITNVSSNERNKKHHHEQKPDWSITGDLTVSLRADDDCDDLRYTIRVACTDDSGNAGQASVTFNAADKHEKDDTGDHDKKDKDKEKDKDDKKKK